MEYVTPIDCGGSDPERAYEDGCRATGQLGSLTPARFYNLMLAEGRNLVEGAGLTLDPNNDAQWLEAVKALLGSVGLVSRTRSILDADSAANTTDGEVEAFRLTHTCVSNGRIRVLARGNHESLANAQQFGIASTIRLQRWNGTGWVNVDFGQTRLASQNDTRIRGFFHMEEERAAVAGETETYRITHNSGANNETSTVFARSSILVEEWDDGLSF